MDLESMIVIGEAPVAQAISFPSRFVSFASRQREPDRENFVKKLEALTNERSGDGVKQLASPTHPLHFMVREVGARGQRLLQKAIDVVAPALEEVHVGSASQ
jgi:hypothetical protein